MANEWILLRVLSVKLFIFNDITRIMQLQIAKERDYGVANAAERLSDIFK